MTFCELNIEMLVQTIEEMKYSKSKNLCLHYSKDKRTIVGDSVGVKVGENVGLTVGEKVGLVVGEKDGLRVGEKLGLNVGDYHK